MEDEYTTLEFLFYGSETNSFFGTVLHLGIVGVAGYFTGKYVAPVVWEAITKKGKDDDTSQVPVEKVIYSPQPTQPALVAPPVISYGA